MSLTAMEYKTQGNKYYSKNESSLAVESYSQAIKLIKQNPEENLPLYLLYSNRSAAYIQDKNYYSGYQDAKESLKLKKNENFKGFYRAAICAYHLGFIDKCEEFIKEATNDHHQNLIDYLDLKLLIEKKLKSMKKWRKPTATAKKSIKNLQEIIENGVLWIEIPPILYQIRYLLRSFFENTKDKKLMNMDTADLGLRLHQLAVQFNLVFPVQKLLKADPIFEDLILNEMPDVGSLRLKSYKQKNFPRDQRDYDLEDKAGNDLTAYEFSFFINNVLASLVVNSSDEKISLGALKQIHRLTTIDLYRQALGDALSDAVNNYIYRNYNNVFLIEKFLSNSGVEILFYDYIEAVWKLSAKKIRYEGYLGIELVQPKPPSRFEIEIKRMINLDPDDVDHHGEKKKDFHLIINVLTKIYFIFGEKAFFNRYLHDPLFLYVNQMWFPQIKNDQHQHNIPYLLNGWTSIITQWLKLDYKNRREYIQQIKSDQLDDDDD